jgi:gliding motility-associated-like protein
MSRRVTIVLLLFCAPLFSQQEQVWLHPNRGQWDERIDYSVELAQGSVSIAEEGFTYFLNDAQSHGHEAHEGGDNHELVRCHVVKSLFEGSTWNGETAEGEKSPFWRNYYYGSDQTRWRSMVSSVRSTTYRNFYDGIDLCVEGGSGKLKYSFIAAPGADVSVIRNTYYGADRIVLDDGSLSISTRFGEIVEESPVAWTVKDGKQTPVAVKFVLRDSSVSYVFPNGYDHSAQLVIDPNIVFSSFTGSTMDNWGMTATPDAQGNLYAGGIVFSGSGSYPTVTGSFDLTYNGGTSYVWQGGTLQGFDVAISKFNANGTSLIYSTYLGGSGNEAPHSLVTDNQGHLYVLGVTSSLNFPVVGGCYDVMFSGGPGVVTNELGFPAGADMYVAHFDQNGAALVGSTFLGGTGTDGINSGPLFYNYGDPFRGEIVVRNGFVYVASSTSSFDFPVVGAFQGSLNGPQDIVVVKLNAALTSVAWSTYVGGSAYDSGNGIQISSSGNIYVTGGTSSTNMPFTTGHTLNNSGGSSDGYVMRMTNATGAVTAGTYIGTNEYDQSFFVQLDQNDAVYIYGQSEGTIPITPGCYGTANSGQFVAKYSSNLQTRTWTTTIGAGTGHVEISPTAFLVSNCNEVYIAGWGGVINSSFSPHAQFSSTSGFPVTADAYQSSTNGSNFWIAVLGENAGFLKYATFIGGSSSSYNHVDGGTSRFDKNGSIYHAVCGACGGNDFGFSTTPGVWSPTNNSTNCNLAAFKFELSTIEAVISDPEPLICLPDPVVFNNNSANGNNFHWDFGDGVTSIEVNPSHVYASAGQYTVTLVVSDTNQCYTPDTVEFLVNIGDFEGGIIQPANDICPGTPYQLEAFGGTVYHWSPAAFLDNPNIFNPTATILETTTFTCIISDSCGVDTAQVTVNVLGSEVDISSDTSICVGNSVPLFVTGSSTVTWSPATYLDDPSSATPVSTPDDDIVYHVTGMSAEGCAISDSVRIWVETSGPQPNMPDTVRYCEGFTKTVIVTGAASYAWSPPVDISPVTGNVVIISSQTDRYYYCDFSNACATIRDSLFADVTAAEVLAGSDTIVCPGEPAFFWAGGGVSYEWQPAVTFLEPDGSQVSARTHTPTEYIVTGTDVNGCRDSARVMLSLFPAAHIQAGPDVYAFFGDEVQLHATSTTSGTYVWSPTEFLSCVNCASPVADPEQEFVYTVSYVDGNGCSDSDDVRIRYDALLYVPNAFTPGDDAYNPVFFASGGNLKTFHMEIFNRWGELIFVSDSLAVGWDGTYEGLKCQDGVYTWKVEYSDFLNAEYERVGHVTLLR